MPRWLKILGPMAAVVAVFITAYQCYEGHQEKKQAALKEHLAKATEYMSGEKEAVFIPSGHKPNKEDLERARKEILEAKHIAPENPAVLQTWAVYLDLSGATEKARAAYEKAMDADPSPSAHNNFAMLQEKFGNETTARDLYQKAVEITEKEPEYAHLCGRYYQRLGTFEERWGHPVAAVAAYRSAIACEPGNNHHHELLSWLFFRMGDLGKAISTAQDCLEIEPLNGMCLAVIGTSNARQERYRQAEIDLKRAHNLLPDDSTILVNLGQVFMERRKFSQAEKLFRKVLSSEPEHLQAHVGLISALKQLGLKQAILAQTDQAKPYLIESPEELFEVADILVDIGECGAALDFLQEAERLGYSHQHLNSHLACALAAVKRYEEALPYAQKSCTEAQATPTSCKILSVIHRQLGNDKEALEALQQYEELMDL